MDNGRADLPEGAGPEALHRAGDPDHHHDEPVLIEPATIGALLEFYGKPPPGTTRALVGRVGDVVFGVVGLMRWEDGYLLFSDYRPDYGWAVKSRAARRAVLEVAGWVRQSRIPVYALADAGEPDSDRLMQRFGFSLVLRSEAGGFYQCRA